MSLQLPRAVGNVERRQLAYSKYILFEGNKHLTDSTLPQSFNISIILFANALEIVLRVLAHCYEELKGNRYDDTAHNILSRLSKKLSDFPTSEFNSVLEARNSIYHSATLINIADCRDKRELTERVFRIAVEKYLGENYESISLVNLIGNKGIREALNTADDELRNDKYIDSIVASCEGLERLKERILRRSREQFKYENSMGVLYDTNISWADIQRRIGRNTNVIRISSPDEIDADSLLRAFSQHIEEQVNKKVINILRLIDFELLLGESYEDYKHFTSNIPDFHMSTNHEIRYDRESFEKRKLTKEDAEFAFNFVLTVTLNLESKFKPINKRNLNQEIRKTIE